MSIVGRTPRRLSACIRPYLVLATVALAAGCQRPAPSGELGKAAAAGDRARLAAILQKTAADTPEDGWGALVWASRAGQVEAVALLLDAGADPNRPDRRQGWTPLMHALHTHQVAVARLLLARGADPRIGSAGTSPVVMATLDNESALVRSMLTAGLPRDQRQRALDEAIGGGALADIDRSLTGTCKTETARELLQHDPALAVDGSGAFFTPLWWARRQGCLETVTHDRSSGGNGASPLRQTARGIATGQGFSPVHRVDGLSPVHRRRPPAPRPGGCLPAVGWASSGGGPAG